MYSERDCWVVDQMKCTVRVGDGAGSMKGVLYSSRWKMEGCNG